MNENLNPPALTSGEAQTVEAENLNVFSPSGFTFLPISRSLIWVRLVSRLIPLLILWLVFVGLMLADHFAIFLIPGFDTPWISYFLYAFSALVIAISLWQLWLVPRQVSAIGYAMSETDLLIRSGVMFKRLTTVPYGRMQFVDISQGPLERVAAIATVQLFTASAGSDARIVGVEKSSAKQLREVLMNRADAQRSGL